MKISAWMVALTGAATLTAGSPASAQVARFDPGVQSSVSSMVTEVQFRGGGMRRFRPGGLGNRGGFGRGGFGDRGAFRNRGFAGGYRGGYGHRRGFGVGAGLAGLAAGAVIGGAIASQAAPGYGYGYGYGGAPAYDPGYAPDYGYAAPQVQTADGDSQAYCTQRYKSYDPSSGTYLGYDGLRHPCP